MHEGEAVWEKIACRLFEQTEHKEGREMEYLAAAKIQEIVETGEGVLIIEYHSLFLRIEGSKEIEQMVGYSRVLRDELDILFIAFRYGIPEGHQFLGYEG